MREHHHSDVRRGRATSSGPSTRAWRRSARMDVEVVVVDDASTDGRRKR